MDTKALARGDIIAATRRYQQIKTSQVGSANPFPAVVILLDDILNCLSAHRDELATLQEAPPFELPGNVEGARPARSACAQR